ncbi:MAG: hypothetical protein B7W98_01925 [Parcubacteria group bacterium 20-58-5]|nr:MAG: hypothetical protein B7W98_01925 [Parcubacteria group bacterium 20-58-5]
MTPQYHQQEFLVRIIRESLAVRADVNQVLAIHEIDDATEIARVARDAIWCPGQYAVELAALNFLHDLIEYRSCPGLLG